MIWQKTVSRREGGVTLVSGLDPAHRQYAGRRGYRRLIWSCQGSTVECSSQQRCRVCTALGWRIEVVFEGHGSNYIFT